MPGAPLDVLVVGAGQAGLALGHELRGTGLRFEVLEAAPQVGDSWRRRWESLRLFTAAEYGSLPGLPFPAPAGTHPGRDDVADYLEAYAETFALLVRTGTPVDRLVRDGTGFTASTPDGPVRARQVVVAVGPHSRPHVPAPAAGLAEEVTQLHSAGYRRPDDVPAGPVLVVGAGNSGLQIAAELAAAGTTVHLADGPVEVRTVLWATGYRPDLSWIEVPGAVSGGAPVHRAGLSAAPGLAFLGLPWQRTRGSALLGFVGADAAWLARRLAAAA